MPEINLYNIDQITRDVGTQEIGFSHLFHDLVDHICCDVEYNMKQGMSFEDAYHVVKMKIGDRGLKKIQEDTLYAVDNKYRKMKNLMKISGVAGTVMLGYAAISRIGHVPLSGIFFCLGAFVLAILFLPSALSVLWKETKNQKKLILFVSAFIAGFSFICGMLLKIQHWPGAALMIIIGLCTGMFLFVPSLLIFLMRDVEKKHKRPIYIAGSVAIILYISGFWFKIMHWPLATTLMLTGSFLLMIVILPWFTRVQWKHETNVNAKFIFMILAPLLIILPGAIVNLNISRNYEYGFYSTIKKHNILIKIQQDRNNAILDLNKGLAVSPKMDSIHFAANGLITVINKIEHNMVSIAIESEGQTNKDLLELSGTNSDSDIDYDLVKAPLNEMPVQLMLLPGCKAREILEKKVSAFKKIISENPGMTTTSSQPEFLNLSEYLPEKGTASYDMPLLPVLNTLSILKSTILFTESEALKYASGKK